jgi:hypothetical protein
MAATYELPTAAQRQARHAGLYRSRLALTSAALGHRAGHLRYDQIVVIRFGRSWGVEWTGQRQWQAGCRQIKCPAALSMCDGAWRFSEPTSAGRKWAPLME